jgi:hypothetical protein
MKGENCVKKSIKIKITYFNCKKSPENDSVTRSIGTDSRDAVDTDENRADIMQPAAQ